jgi:septum site-determining protein MinC
MEGAISIKGTREGLAVYLGQGDLDGILDVLSRHLKQQGAFFRGGVVTLEAGDRPLSVTDIARFQELFAQHAMVLRSISTTDQGARDAAMELGLRAPGSDRQSTATPLVEPSPMPPQGASPPVLPEPAPPALDDSAEGIARAGARGLVLRRRVRAGQTVRHSGSVVIIGDVNAGAEIVAGGDIVVWGRLRGMVHAGCLGNTSAVVCALDLAPLQLRIAELITRPEDGNPGREGNYPEVAYVRDRAIIVERWTAIRWRD